MSIASEITRINNNIANAYTSLNAKGATMPQDQNSANLADTIDSITTGGGGGGSTFPYTNDLNTVKGIIEETFFENNDYSDSKLQSLGFTTMNSGTIYQTYNIGMVYDETAPLIVLRDTNNSLRAYKIPSSATFTSLDTNKFQITFGSDERWVCLVFKSSTYAQLSNAITYYSKRTNSSGSTYDKLAKPVAVYHSYTPQNSTTLSNTIGSTALNANWLCGIKNLTFRDNITFSDFPEQYYFKQFLAMDNFNDLIKHFTTYYDSNTELCTIPSTIINAMNASDGGYYNIFPELKTGMPLILDYSTWSGTGTATLIPTNTVYTTPLITTQDIRIKLPSTYSTVNLTYTLPQQNNYSIKLKPVALQYLATNAPTVTSCTLKVGYENMAYLTYTTDGQSIVSTLNGKGWTVSA